MISLATSLRRIFSERAGCTAETSEGDLRRIKVALDKHRCCAFAPDATYNMCGDVYFILKCEHIVVEKTEFKYVGICIQCKEWTKNSPNGDHQSVIDAFRMGKLTLGGPFAQYNYNLKTPLHRRACRCGWLKDVYWVHALMTEHPLPDFASVGPHEAFISLGGTLGEDCPVIRQSLIAGAN